MTEADFDYDYDLVGEAPCEFCNKLFPLMLLIEHETTHLAEDYELYEDPGFFQNSSESNEPKVEVEQKQASSPVVEVTPPLPVIRQKISSKEDELRQANEKMEKLKVEISELENKSQQPKIAWKPKEFLNSLIKPIKKAVEKKPSSQIKKNESKKYLTVEDFTTEGVEKLLVYGADVDPDKDFENEKQTYKMPNNPLLDSIPKEEDVEDISNLTDDECDESLEEFWKRARDYLKRNRMKT